MVEEGAGDLRLWAVVSVERWLTLGSHLGLAGGGGLQSFDGEIGGARGSDDSSVSKLRHYHDRGIFEIVVDNWLMVARKKTFENGQSKKKKRRLTGRGRQGAISYRKDDGKGGNMQVDAENTMGFGFIGCMSGKRLVF